MNVLRSYCSGKIILIPSALQTPKDVSAYDHDHFEFINREVRNLNKIRDSSVFVDTPLSTHEVQKAVNKFKKDKACGFDCVSAKHIKYGGAMLIITITIIFNMIIKLEYIPTHFRRGTQISLFKGENVLCSTDTNNNRSITLLSTFRKIYELII